MTYIRPKKDRLPYEELKAEYFKNYKPPQRIDNHGTPQKSTHEGTREKENGRA